MASPSAKLNMPDIGRRIVEIPEFLTSVASEFDLDRQRELMLVSKYFFRSVGPIVWKSVPRLDFIMRTIKGTKVKSYRFEDSQKAHYEFTEITITLPLNPDLSRYNIYAPWVQELELFDECSQEIKNLDPFLTLLDGQAPLPNLRRLTTYTGASNLSGKELMDFINMFFTPSLREIRTFFHQKGIPSYLDAVSIPNFFEKIEETCPRIQALEFYPQSPYGYSSPFTLTDRSRDILRSFSNLRSFISTTYILESATFGILGSLPHLESLGIRGSAMEDPILDEQFSLPPNSFEELIDLQLYDIHPQDIKVLWGQPSIARKLGSAFIQTDPTSPPNPSDGPRDGNNWIDTFLLALPGLSPHLHDLTFYVGDDDGTEFQISQDARDGLRKLGLKKFEVKLKTDEDSEGDPYDDDDYDDYI
ncbi:hypothetical protein RSOLAG1IB_03858 [Rhizoctonia solani AG-1 IB]|uniref:F-box domain-containing protein n=1 Tax=Thanatephorus cucumeris (strain AG1-IB / isolate 7/3/14) TaxID=1108050 RepID=A0A0B7FSI0_THACB|nr:hypothetical protein RSOLAG1IB_03858 [Rhizoctonia solani AG-1 IB]